jgi:hypothetical protein
MPAAYPVNSYQPVIPFDGEPDPAMGVLGQVGVDISSGAYHQKIGGKWYPYGQGPIEPTLATLSGVPHTDNAPADGVGINVVKFIALDQNGAGMQVTLNLSSNSPTAVMNMNTMVTGSSDGSATVSVTDTVAEAVTITATSGGQTANVTSTFIEPARRF